MDFNIFFPVYFLFLFLLPSVLSIFKFFLFFFSNYIPLHFVLDRIQSLLYSISCLLASCFCSLLLPCIFFCGKAPTLLSVPLFGLFFPSEVSRCHGDDSQPTRRSSSNLTVRFKPESLQVTVTLVYIACFSLRSWEAEF